MSRQGKYDKKNKKPSGTYLQVATNIQLPHNTWRHNCKLPLSEHILDWYGKTPEQAKWRRKVSQRMVTTLCDALNGRGKSKRTGIILDDNLPPSPTMAPVLSAGIPGATQRPNDAQSFNSKSQKDFGSSVPKTRVCSHRKA